MMATVQGRRVRVGAIGAGWFATTNHFPILAAREDVELVAVCRPDADLLMEVQEHFGFSFATEDYRELLAHELDAVLVATPHLLHYEHARAALEAGCHVLCEKPLTLSAAQAWELVELAQERGLHLLVPHGWHYADYIKSAKQLLDDGIIGEIEFVSCFMATPTKDLFTGGGAAPSNLAETLTARDMRTWQDSARGGGFAWGQLTHSTALALWLTGLRAASVAAVTLNATAGVDMYDAATVEFTNGAIGSVIGAATLPKGSKFQIDLRVFGRDGVFLLDIERERAEFLLHDGTTIAVPAEAGDGDYRCDVPPSRFIELITGASQINPSPGEVAARSVELVEALRRSAIDDGRREPVTIG